MPELPEVETTRSGIEPHVLDQTVVDTVVRQPRLRWPIPRKLVKELTGNTIESVSRRGKYLLLEAGDSTLIIHLGMSGSLRIVDPDTSAGTHDHVDIVFGNDKVLRFNDPRRFGCILWHKGNPEDHKLLRNLGPEPLQDVFDGEYLFAISRNKKAPVKTFIMDSKIVVGVGNIYANESLHLSGIHPVRKAGKISLQRYRTLATNIKEVLSRAIKVGGTTLRDFTNSDGEPGYFRQSLFVYGRAGESCKNCGASLKEVRISQRSTVYCPVCQR